MEYIGFVFGIFGLMAYLQVSGLKNRVTALERELARIQGTSYHDDRKALLQAARSLIGQKVNIELKEGHEDADIVSYGNTRYGSNTILDADEDWLLVHIDSPKQSMDKLIRLESVKRLGMAAKEEKRL